MSKAKKIDLQAVKEAAPRAVLRLLPIGALFLPLGTVTISLGALGSLFGLGDLGGGGGSGTPYNIVGLIKSVVSPDSELMRKLLQTDMMDGPRAWLYVTGAGLILSILAMLAGFAFVFIFAEKVKPLAAGAAVYAAGVLGAICGLAGFMQFGAALGPATMNLASTAVNYGAYVLAAMLLLNLAVCLAQWRRVKEQERLAALAKKQKQKKKKKK